MSGSGINKDMAADAMGDNHVYPAPQINRSAFMDLWQLIRQYNMIEYIFPE